MTGPAISIHDAEIKTATITVRAMKIEGRQVTMAVFRQLIAESPFDDDLAWRGIPWGFVNYFWKPCDPDHLHLVWQQGDELRRACIWPDRIEKRREYKVRDERADLTLDADLARWAYVALELKEWVVAGKPVVIGDDRSVVTWGEGGRLGSKPKLDELLFDVGILRCGPWIEPGKHEPDYVDIEQLDSFVAKIGEWCDLEPEASAFKRAEIEIRNGRLPRLESEWKTYSKRVDELRREIRDLPQLFIAT